MTKSKGRLEPRNSENLAKALSGLEDGTYKNPNQASKATGTPVTTIYNHLRGRKSRREVNAKNQALTPAEEMALVQWVQHFSATGHPVRHQFLLELAKEIRNQRLKPVGNIVTQPLGQKWVQRFLKRNPTI